MYAVESPPMPKPKRNDRPAKIDAEVLSAAAVVAAYRGIPIAEYISERLRPLVIQDLKEHQGRGDRLPEPRRKAKD